jgi:hypothetical protein
MTVTLQEAYETSVAVFSRSFQFAEWKFVNCKTIPPQPFADADRPTTEAILKVGRDGTRAKWLYVFRDGGDFADNQEEFHVDEKGAMSVVSGKGRTPVGNTVCLKRMVLGNPQIYRLYASRVRLQPEQIKSLRTTIQKFVPRTSLAPGRNTSVVVDGDKLFVPAVDPLTVALHLHAAYEAAADEVINYTLPHDQLDADTKKRVARRRKKQLLAQLIQSLMGDRKAKARDSLADRGWSVETYLDHYATALEHRVRIRNHAAKALVSWLDSPALRVAYDAHKAAGKDSLASFLKVWYRVHRRLSEAPEGRTYLKGVLATSSHFARPLIWPDKAAAKDVSQDVRGAIRKSAMAAVEAWKEFAAVRVLIVSGSDIAGDAASSLNRLLGGKTEIVKANTAGRIVISGSDKQLAELGVKGLGAVIELVNFALVFRDAMDPKLDAEARQLALINLVGSGADAASAVGSLLKQSKRRLSTLGFVSGVIDVYLGIKSAVKASDEGDPDAAAAAVVTTVGSGIGTVGSLLGLLAIPGAGPVAVLGLAIVAFGHLLGFVHSKSPLEIFLLHSQWGAEALKGTKKPSWSPTTFSEWGDAEKGLDRQLEALLNIVCEIEVSKGSSERDFQIKAKWLPPSVSITLTYAEQWKQPKDSRSHQTTITLDGSNPPKSSNAVFVVTPISNGVSVRVPDKYMGPTSTRHPSKPGSADEFQHAKVTVGLTLKFDNVTSANVPHGGPMIKMFNADRPEKIWRGTMQELEGVSDGGAAGALELETPFLSAHSFAAREVRSGSAEAPRESEDEGPHEAWLPQGEALVAPGDEPEATAEVELEDEWPFERPREAPKLPSTAELQRELAKIKFSKVTPQAQKSLAAALKAMGEAKRFEAALIPALKAAPWLSESKNSALVRIFARLGAEAFVFGVQVPEAQRQQLGFIHDPSLIREALQRSHAAGFVHFSCERLRQLVTATLDPTERRQQIQRAVKLFGLLTSVRNNEFLRQVVGVDPDLVLAYRRLLFSVVWKHYQSLMDSELAAARGPKPRSPSASKALKAALDSASATGVHDEDTTIATFRTARQTFEDYFVSKDPPSIGFQGFSARSDEQAKKAHESSFRSVVERRKRQFRTLEEFEALSAGQGLPSLHDTASFAAWLRGRWDNEWSKLPLPRRLRAAVSCLGKYFGDFTLHVPHDIREGCKEKNYLTRVFPRAVSGAALHDCAVYAARWPALLGGILDAKRAGEGIAKPRVFLIEMPAHVGVMIRLARGSGKELVVAINNQDAQIYEDVAESSSDRELAVRVAQDMYPALCTPFRVLPIAASPADPKAFWNEVCRLFDKKLTLPYEGPDEPHLRYLHYKAESTRIYVELRNQIVTSWSVFKEPPTDEDRKADANRKPGEPQDCRFTKQPFSCHLAAIQKLAVEARKAHEKEVDWIADEINATIRERQSRFPPGVFVAPLARVGAPWLKYPTDYIAKLNTERRAVEPFEFLPEQDFVPALPR